MANYTSTHTGAEIDAAVDNIKNVNLSAEGFTPSANTYYKHTGATTSSFTKGVIYFYDGTKYNEINGNKCYKHLISFSMSDNYTYKLIFVNRRNTPFSNLDDFVQYTKAQSGLGYANYITPTAYQLADITKSLIYVKVFGLGTSENPYKCEIGIYYNQNYVDDSTVIDLKFYIRNVLSLTSDSVSEA